MTSALPSPPSASSSNNNNSALSSLLINKNTSDTNIATYKYGQVLHTITELQQELEKTIRVATNLKNENTLLRTNYNDIQHSLSRTQKRLKETHLHNNSTGSNTQSSQDPSFLAEQALVQCRAQLDQCTKDLEAAIQERNNALMKSEETVRNQLREELLLFDTFSNSNNTNNNKGSKLCMLEKEVEKWRNDYYHVKNEAEGMKLIQQNNSDVISEREMALEAEISVLSSSLEKLVQGKTCCLQSCDNSKKAKEMMMLDVHLKDEDSFILNIQTQLIKSQKERDQQELENIALVARHQEDLVPKMKQLALLDADKHLLETRCEGMHAELKRINEANNVLKEIIIVLNKEKGNLLLTESMARPRFDKEFAEAEWMADYKRREIISANKIQSLEKHIGQLKKDKMESLQMVASERQLALEQQKMKSLNAEKDLEASDKARMQLQQKIVEYQAQRAHFEKESKTRELEYVSTVQKLKHECGLHRITAERITMEKESMVRRVVAAEKTTEQLKASLLPIQQELALKTEENDDLVNELSATEQKIIFVEGERDVLRMEALRAKEDVQSWKKSNDEKQSLCQTKIGRLTAELSREKKVSKCYKEKAMDAHKKTRLAKQTLERCYMPFC